MADLQTFIDKMRWWCAAGNLGYDQSNRWDVRIGGETDCSALVIHVLREAGFDTGSATYTGNMRRELTARGWVIAVRQPTSTALLKAGDILLNDANHVAVYLGGGLLAQASIDERGRISGGQPGDQTDYETNVRGFYVYGHGGWNVALRYVGGQTGVEVYEGPGNQYNPNAYDQAYVKGVQELLIRAGYSVGSDGADGILGANTYAAVKKYQQDHPGLQVDGIPGPQTIASLKGGSITPRAIAVTPAALDVDGRWGEKTTRRLQEVLGTPVDGIVSSQEQAHLARLAACTTGWEFVSNPQGSQVIAAMQRKLGVDPDGIVGPGTIDALSARYGIQGDGKLDAESITVKAMQEALNEGRF